jgi:hypothetical protein
LRNPTDDVDPPTTNTHNSRFRFTYNKETEFKDIRFTAFVTAKSMMGNFFFVNFSASYVIVIYPL